MSPVMSCTLMAVPDFFVPHLSTRGRAQRTFARRCSVRLGLRNVNFGPRGQADGDWARDLRRLSAGYCRGGSRGDYSEQARRIGLRYRVLVSLLTMSMSRLTAAVLRKSDPMPPRPPSLDTAAANYAEVQVPMGARMIGTSIPNKSQSGVLSIL